MARPVTAQQPFLSNPIIALHVDGDGTLYEDLALYKGLCEDVPELDYYPTIDYAEMDRRFKHEQLEAAQSSEAWDGVSIVNGLLLEMVRRGELAGLNNAVLRELGYRHIKLLPGAADFMRDAHALVHDLSGGEIKLEITINTCNLREGAVGSELGDLMTEGVVQDITGQVFSEHQVQRSVKGVSTTVTELRMAIRNHLGESKAARIGQDLRANRVDPDAILTVGDGLTDLFMFERNESGFNLLVNSMRNPDRYAELHRYVADHPGQVGGPMPNDWRRHPLGDESFGPLYLALMTELKDTTRLLQRRIEAHRSTQPPPSRIPHYTSRRSTDLGAALRVSPSRRLSPAPAPTETPAVTDSHGMNATSTTPVVPPIATRSSDQQLSPSLHLDKVAAEAARRNLKCYIETPGSNQISTRASAQQLPRLAIVLPPDVNDEDEARLREMLVELGVDAKGVVFPDRQRSTTLETPGGNLMVRRALSQRTYDMGLSITQPNGAQPVGEGIEP